MRETFAQAQEGYTEERRARLKFMDAPGRFISSGIRTARACGMVCGRNVVYNETQFGYHYFVIAMNKSKIIHF